MNTPRSKASAAIIVVLLATLVGLAWYWFSHYQAERNANAKSAEEQYESVLRGLAYRNAADPDWARTVSEGKKYRVAPIQTVELQQLWPPGRKILFVARVLDITQTNTGLLKLLVEYDGLAAGTSFLDTNIRLELTCTEEQLAKVLVAARKSDRMNLTADIAVAAQINQVRGINPLPDESDKTKTIIGTGFCLEAMPLGSQRFQRQ